MQPRGSRRSYQRYLGMAHWVLTILVGILIAASAAAERQGAPPALTKPPRPSPEGTAMMREYLALVGAPEELLDRMSSTGPAEIYWLTEGDKRALGIKRAE